ncbi:hypothetical protein ACFLS1_03310 [Verrucomicrobiota bacterium]
MKIWIITSVLLVIVFATGCTSIPNVPKNNIVMVNGKGSLVNPGPNLFKFHCKLRPYKRFKTDEEKIAHLNSVIDQLNTGIQIQAARGMEKRKVMIFIHGGLNTQVETVKRAANIFKAMKKDKAHEQIAPVFINWQSSLASSYTDHLLYIRQGKDMRNDRNKLKCVLTTSLCPFYFVADLLKAIGKAPIIWTMQCLNNVGRNFDSDDVKTARKRFSNKPEIYDVRQGKKEYKHSLGTQLLNFTSKILFPVRILTSPFVDALGGSSWDNMYRRTSTPFNRDKDFNREEFYFETRGWLARFFEQLREVEKDMNGKLEITLIGHSMGTIMINEILRKYDDMNIKNIVYMAAACSVRNYHDSVYPYLKKHDDTKMYHLVLHDRAEFDERPWAWLDIAPRGSLLVWIDHFLAKPNTKLDRTAGRYCNLMITDHLTPLELLKRIHVKQFDYGSGVENTQPQKHGDFDAFPFWERDFWEPHKIPEDKDQFKPEFKAFRRTRKR